MQNMFAQTPDIIEELGHEGYVFDKRRLERLDDGLQDKLKQLGFKSDENINLLAEIILILRKIKHIV